MLKKVILHNFKGHKSTELNFDNSRLHGIVGKNSAGKTSVLQALHNLSRLAARSISHVSFREIFQYDQSPQFITTIGETDMSVSVSGFWKETNQEIWEVSYSYHLKQKEMNPWTPDTKWKINENEGSWDKGKTKILTKFPEDTTKTKRLTKYPDAICKSLKPTVYLKLDASKLAKAAYSDEVTPRIESDGSGLAPTLDFVRNEAPDKFQLIEKVLCKIVPNVRKIGIKRAKVPVIRERFIEVDGKPIHYEDTQEMTGQEVVLDMNTGERIPAHAISEGTMLTLGLLTVLMNPTQPNLVLLDDIEQGLHPQAQRELMTVFKEIIAENPNLQIIFSTHSPYILDALAPSQVHILNNSNSGFTIAKRLDEHPDVEWAKETLTTGEFWDAEGEDWVVEGEVSD
ncbi:AAA family ATPase [Anabaena sp. UHCC 0187]|uniref:AAA family ATPase n=1 Tax=Anabaena sp. UHCC 0187 TaxID=2590018 RepID=UPI0014484C4E|nr:ATP-binding protein [Anabaena sp. UHCC 0187]MTJ12891.1 AAA family ATPase [Anabaena sp. UHCC 0187]